MKVLLIDDEKNALTALRRMIEQFCPGVTVAGEAQTAIEGLRLIKQLAPDVVFLDVEMPGGTGFDLLNNIDEKRFNVVFTTAHEHYAIPALRSGAADYLLKPVSIDELRNAIARLSSAKENQTGVSPEHQRYKIITPEGTWFMPYAEIICIQGEGRYSRIFVGDNKEYVVAHNLGEIEKELSAARFFRVHKSWLVNCMHVRQIANRDGGFAVLSNGKEIEISRRKKAEFIQLLEL